MRKMGELNTDEANGKISTVKKLVKSEKTGKLRDFGENGYFKAWNEMNNQLDSMRIRKLCE